MLVNWYCLLPEATAVVIGGQTVAVSNLHNHSAVLFLGTLDAGHLVVSDEELSGQDIDSLGQFEFFTKTERRASRNLAVQRAVSGALLVLGQ